MIIISQFKYIGSSFLFINADKRMLKETKNKSKLNEEIIEMLVKKY